MFLKIQRKIKKINFFSKIFEDLNLRLIISPAYHYTYDNLFGNFFPQKSEIFNFS